MVDDWVINGIHSVQLTSKVGVFGANCKTVLNTHIRTQYLSTPYPHLTCDMQHSILSSLAHSRLWPVNTSAHTSLWY